MSRLSIFEHAPFTISSDYYDRREEERQNLQRWHEEFLQSEHLRQQQHVEAELKFIKDARNKAVFGPKQARWR